MLDAGGHDPVVLIEMDQSFGSTVFRNIILLKVLERGSESQYTTQTRYSVPTVYVIAAVL